MTTFLAHPDGPGPFPLAILFMDGVGYREQIRENARRFAAAGYYVAAPDLFYRSGRGSASTSLACRTRATVRGRNG